MNFIVFSRAAMFVTSSSVIGSARDSLRNELKQVRDCWFFLLLLCTAIVAIGVVLEEAEQWLPLGKPQLDMVKGIFVPSHWIERRKAVMRIGWVLIVLGVVGEGVFEATTSVEDGVLQDFNDTLSAMTTVRAGNAAISATTARKEAERAKDEADQASKLADKVQGKAEQIVAAIRRPTLNNDDIKSIADRLRPCARPKVPVVIISEFWNGLGIPVWEALKQGGFDNADVPLFTNQAWYGDSVSGPLEVDKAMSAACIQTALIRSGKFTFGLIGIDNRPGAPVTVRLGDEPMGNLPDIERKKPPTRSRTKNK